MELILHFSVHYANIRVFCETTKFLVEFLLHAQAVTVAIFINVRKTALSDCLPIFFRLPCPPLGEGVLNPLPSPRQFFYAGWDRRGAIADFQVHPLLRLSGFEGLWRHSP